MRALVWRATFKRAYKRLARRDVVLQGRVAEVLRQLAHDPFQARLRSHKLTGELQGVWSCTVGYDYRILFEIQRNPETGAEEILLLTMGTHDEVY